MMTLVYGGSSSGKSAFAEQLAMESEAERFYVATMIAWDEECRERIRKHRAMRKEKRFTTLEAPVDVGNVSFPEGSTVLLECVSNLAANESFRADFKEPEAEAMERILSGIETLRRYAGELFVVSNDVSGDGERFSEETENYRKLLGEVNQRLARMADRVYEVTGGIPVRLKEGRAGKDVHMILVTGGAHQGKPFRHRPLSLTLTNSFHASL